MMSTVSPPLECQMCFYVFSFFLDIFFREVFFESVQSLFFLGEIGSTDFKKQFF